MTTRAVGRSCGRWRLFGARRRQFSERLHLPPAARTVDRLAGVRLPVAAGASSSWFENMPVVSYAGAARPLPHVPRGRSRSRIRSSRRSRRPCSSPALVVLRAGRCCWLSRLMFGCALIVLFAIDLEHHLLPNVITLPGIVVGFAFEPVHRAGLAGLAPRHSASAAACCTRLPKATTACGTRKAWAWAT